MNDFIPGLRQLGRQIRRSWSNRHCLPRLLSIYSHDHLEKHSLGVLRRIVGRGHSLSAALHRPVDQCGQPIPWYTYPFLDFLADWDPASWEVLEFGSGQSTLYWSRRAARVVSYESKKDWMEELRPHIPANVDLRWVSCPESLDELSDLPKTPDLVIIDGWEREYCARRCLEVFGAAPLYVLDNSDWYGNITDLFRRNGCQEIRFKGFGPINNYAWSTSLFVTSTNLEKLNGIAASQIVPGGGSLASAESRQSPQGKNP